MYLVSVDPMDRSILSVVMIDNFLAIIEPDKLFNLLKTAGA